MKSRSTGLVVLLAVFGLLATALGPCKPVDAPEKYPPVSQPESQGLENSTEPRTADSAPAVGADARNFVLVYQSMLEGEIEPCG